jgi:two-component system response regulator YesN
MIKVLIADDERLTRAGLKKILTDRFSDLEVSEARNGQLALESILQNKPDIMITDIRMPVIDGIGLMNKVSQMDNPPKMIVLSGYGNFTYAQEAIRNGAISYILKPVDKKELFEVMNTVLAAVRKEKQAKNTVLLENIVETGRIPKKHSDCTIPFGKPYYCLLVGGPDYFLFYTEKLKDENCHLLEDSGTYLSILIEAGLAETIFSGGELYDCFVGVSSKSSSLADIKILKQQAFRISFCSLVTPDEKKVRVFRYTTNLSDGKFSTVSAQVDKILLQLGITDESVLSEKVNILFEQPDSRIYDETVQEKAAFLYCLYTVFVYEFIGRYNRYHEGDTYLQSKAMMIKSVLSFSTTEEWEHAIADYILYLNAILRRNSVSCPFVIKAVEYIKQNYVKDINMAIVANYVSVNYTYFSEKFKVSTGMNFNGYLKKIRIENSKRLLEKGCYKVYEVAARSGFSDVKHFIRIFKQETGLSPLRYKQKMNP